MVESTSSNKVTNPLANKDTLDNVVKAIENVFQDPIVRETYSQRAVQCLVWHNQPYVSNVLSELRTAEETIRREIMYISSQLIYQFHTYAIDATMARAGIRQQPIVNKDDNGANIVVVHPGSSLQKQDGTDNNDNGNKATINRSFDVFCLDSKERMYIVLKQYNWIEEFFRAYPLHFYENSFQFIDRIPSKGKLPIRVKVIGLGIGGSIACSGLAKYNIKTVHGYEKRNRSGPRSVTSRYQNASWRAYDIAANLVDETAFNTLVSNRQRVLITYDDGTTSIQTSDRVQIIIGSAIDSAVESAIGYGASIHFNAKESDYYNAKNSIVNSAEEEEDDEEKYDLVGLFCGAHTAYAFNDCLPDVLHIHEWPTLDSKCMMWLQIKPSLNTDSTFCTRGGDIGCEKWHYSISSTRTNVIDIHRIQWNQQSQYEYYCKKFDSSNATNGTLNIGMLTYHSKQDLTTAYEKQKLTLDTILNEIVQKQKQQQQQNQHGIILDGNELDNENKEEKEETTNEQVPSSTYFDYIFTNAPANECNLKKRQQVEDNVVLDGEYTVEVKIAANSTVYTTPEDRVQSKDVVDVDLQRRQMLLKAWNTNVIVCGGDACVPPNPLAAYGATLACEAAGNFVLLAVATGHLNAILNDLTTFMDNSISSSSSSTTTSLLSLPTDIKQWKEQVQYLKLLFVQYYEARSRSENYFQWVQTVICNLYSLPQPQSS